MRNTGYIAVMTFVTAGAIAANRRRLLCRQDFRDRGRSGRSGQLALQKGTSPQVKQGCQA
jgi:hypothetical protein